MCSTGDRLMHLLPAAALALLLAACGSEDAEVTKSKVGDVPAAPQRPGDPVAGRDAFLNRSAVTCGLPLSAYRASVGDTDPDLLIPGRTGPNAELPYMVTAFTNADGVELATTNCLACHAAPLDGEIVIGLGNELLDFTESPAVAAEAAGLHVRGEAEAAAWRRWSDRIAAIAPYMITDTIGANPANNLTLALLAHRDPQTLAWSEEPLLEPPPEEPLPVSVPPLWNVDKKHAMFYNAEGRGDHVRFMILASTTCTDDVEEAARIDAWFTDARAYLASLEAPAWPHAIDAGLAAEGDKLFRHNCRRCHGTYGENESYPNRVVELDKVGTDPLLAEKAFNEADRFIRWFNRSWYAGDGIATAAPAPGYIAPPLDGVWATAPYLHNGSVPSLAALLDSSTRPAYWRHASKGGEYDPKAVGWAYEALSGGKETAMSWDERKRIYDTTRPGYGNQGHTFGDELSPQERAALIEYLKTL